MPDYRAQTPPTAPSPNDQLRQQISGPKTMLTLKGGADPVRVLTDDPLRIEYVIHNQSNYNIAFGNTSQIKEALLGKGGAILLSLWKFRGRDQDELWLYATQDALVALTTEVRVG